MRDAAQAWPVGSSVVSPHHADDVVRFRWLRLEAGKLPHVSEVFLVGMQVYGYDR
jgi:hypothetical protein